jgi:hypothetical protein
MDPSAHASFAEIVSKVTCHLIMHIHYLIFLQRFLSSALASELETLGHLSKILYTHEHALEILSLHVRLSDLVAHALAVLEDYDCESVGQWSCIYTFKQNFYHFTFRQVIHKQRSHISEMWSCSSKLHWGGIMSVLCLLYHTFY